MNQTPLSGVTPHFDPEHALAPIAQEAQSDAARHWKLLSFLMVAFVFAVMAVRQHRFVDHYCVNLLFRDQWDFYQPFEGDTLWGSFDHQHGPHRMGIGLVLARALAKVSHFNTRWDAFAISFLLILAAALAVPLAWHCGARQPLALLPIPMLFLNQSQFEQFICAPDISHGAMPIFLLMLLCLSWFVRWDSGRLFLIVVLTFLLIFTGFGVFAGILTPILLLIEAVQSFRAQRWGRGLSVSIALLLVAFSWGLFLRNYSYPQAAAGTGIGKEPALDYLFCFAGMLAHAFAVRGGRFIIVSFGLSVAILLAALCIGHGWHIVKDGPLRHRHRVIIFCLAAYALIYTTFTVIGRTSMGWLTVSVTSRYVTLLIPAGLAICLQLAVLKRSGRSTYLFVMLATWLCYGAVILNHREWEEVNRFHTGQVAWKAAYLLTRDENLANQRAQFTVYPVPGAITRQLQYLEKNRLNLFQTE